MAIAKIATTTRHGEVYYCPECGYRLGKVRDKIKHYCPTCGQKID